MVPLPVLETLMVCDVGLAPPAVAEKVSELPETVSTGGGAATLRVTPMGCGEPETPVAVTVTVPE